MVYARSNRLGGTGARTGRRSTRKRVSNLTKIKYQKPSAKLQRRQILSNARTLARHSRLLAQHKIYTDYQVDDAIMPAASGQWAVARLTDFANWTPVLRQSDVVTEKAHTFVIRMSINFRVLLNAADFLGFNCFVVTKRKNAAQYDPYTTPPTINTDYIESSQAQGFNLRLNPSLYKVHFSKYFSLTHNALLEPTVATTTSGNPNTTWRKFQVNLPCRMNVTNPAIVAAGSTSWLHLNFENLPPYHQYFIMVYAVWGGTGTPIPSCSFDCLATCINTA